MLIILSVSNYDIIAIIITIIAVLVVVAFITLSYLYFNKIGKKNAEMQLQPLHKNHVSSQITVLCLLFDSKFNFPTQWKKHSPDCHFFSCFYILINWYFSRFISDNFWKKRPLSNSDFEIKAPTIIREYAVVPIIK